MDNCKRGSLSLIVVSLVAAGVLIASALVVKTAGLAAPWRVVVTLLPMPVYVVVIVQAVRLTRRSDEMKQRIQLEALAVAVLGMLLATGTYGMLEQADVGLAPLDWSMVWVVTTVFYIAGTLIAWRRYR